MSTFVVAALAILVGAYLGYTAVALHNGLRPLDACISAVLVFALYPILFAWMYRLMYGRKERPVSFLIKLKKIVPTILRYNLLFPIAMNDYFFTRKTGTERNRILANLSAIKEETYGKYIEIFGVI